MNRAYYSVSLKKFLNDSKHSILGELTQQHQFSLDDLQRNAWISQIEILKKELTNLSSAYLESCLRIGVVTRES